MKRGGYQLGVSAAWISILIQLPQYFFITMAISICDDVIILSPGKEWETPDVSQKSILILWSQLLSDIINCRSFQTDGFLNHF